MKTSHNIAVVMAIAFAFYLGVEMSGSAMSSVTVEGYALFVAFCAFSLAVFEGLSTRHHNELSLKPVLSFRTRVFSEKTEEVKLELVNCGTGPAFIKDCKVKFDGKPIDHKTHEDWRKILSALKLTSKKFTPYVFDEEIAIREGEIVNALLIQVDSKRQENLSTGQFQTMPVHTAEEVTLELMRFNIEITYECIYGNQYTKEWPPNFNSKRTLA